MENSTKLTTEQVELLTLICAITEYAETDKSYETAVDETIADILDENIASTKNYEILEHLGYIDDECFATIEGMQYIKLLNEYCKNQKDEHKCFVNINIKELNFSLLSIKAPTFMDFVAKLLSSLFSGEK